MAAYLCLADIHGTLALVRKNPPTVRKGPCGGVVPCHVFRFRLRCLYRAAPSSGSHVVGALLRGRNARATGRDIQPSVGTVVSRQTVSCQSVSESSSRK